MKYDFTSILDRHGKDAIAVDAVGAEGLPFSYPGPKEGFDVIPMWVADMNFPVVPTIQEAMMSVPSTPPSAISSPARSTPMPSSSGRRTTTMLTLLPKTWATRTVFWAAS